MQCECRYFLSTVDLVLSRGFIMNYIRFIFVLLLYLGIHTTGEGAIPPVTAITVEVPSFIGPKKLPVTSQYCGDLCMQIGFNNATLGQNACGAICKCTK